MPTNFTVVPVDDGRKPAEEDSDDNNVLKEEDEETVGEAGSFLDYGVCESKQPSWSSCNVPLQVNLTGHCPLFVCLPLSLFLSALSEHAFSLSSFTWVRGACAEEKLT